MDAHLFWFNDEQRAKIARHLPAPQPGPRRKDDRLIVSGIMQGPKASANFQLRFRPKGRLGNEARARGWMPLARLRKGIWPAQDDRYSRYSGRRGGARELHRSRKHAPSRYFALGCQSPIAAPAGSRMIEKEPAPITSVTSLQTVAPSDFALAVAAATSSTST